MGLSFKQFLEKYPDDKSCLKYIFDLKYGKDHACSKCGQVGKWHMLGKRRAYICQTPECGKTIYPCADTPFAKSRTSLQSWFFAIYLFSASRHGVPAKELERQLGVTYKCAWRMAHEIRKYMGKLNGRKPLQGVVEVDETWIGGHINSRTLRDTNKTIVVGMVERGGRVRTAKISSRKKTELLPILKRNIKPGSTIYTDDYLLYKNNLPELGYNHDSVNHSKDEYVRDQVYTNTIEGYWSGLKRGIKGAHIHVSKKHLSNYGAEFEYRYNRRQEPDQILSEMLAGL